MNAITKWFFSDKLNIVTRLLKNDTCPFNGRRKVSLNGHKYNFAWRYAITLSIPVQFIQQNSR